MMASSAKDKLSSQQSYTNDEILQENKSLKAKIYSLEKKLSDCQELQQIAEESRNRIKDVQEACLEQADKLQHGLAKKHQQELMEKIEEQLNLEMEWQKEKRELLLKIEDLSSTIKQLHIEADEASSNKSQIQELIAQLDGNRHKMRELEECNLNTVAELERLQNVERRNSLLCNDLLETQQHVKELDFSVSRLESLLNLAKEENIEQVKRTAQQAKKHGVELATRESRISELEQQLHRAEACNVDLMNKMDLDRQNMKSVEVELERLRTTVVECKTNHQQDDSSSPFGDYVKLKRQFVILQEENDRLKEDLKSKCRGDASGDGSVLHVLHVERNTRTQAKTGIKATKSLPKRSLPRNP